ncbi:MAG TPA: hypothetical protein PLX66_03290 [Bacilli bacterium]|nr:hypothetical protein [Bacilli bacterium]
MTKELQLKIIRTTYDYINRVIDEKELIRRFDVLLNEKLTPKERKQIIKLKEQIEHEIKCNYKNSKQDQEYNTERIKKLTNIIKDVKMPKTFIEDLKQKINNFKADKTTLRNNIGNLLTFCPLYIEILKNMETIELMELITNYIGGAMPNIDKKTLNAVIDEAIKTKLPENGWRIAFNYDKQLKNKSKIENFIVSTGSGYHIAEMANAGFIGIHINKLVEGIIATKDVKEMSYFIISVDKEILGTKNKTKIEETIKKLGGWEAYQNYIEKPYF